MLARKAPMRVKPRKAPTAGQPSTVHHVTSDGYQRLTRTHQRIAPLCPTHHMVQFGPRESVEALGHAGFTATYGIDLLAKADELWMQSEAANDG